MARRATAASAAAGSNGMQRVGLGLRDAESSSVVVELVAVVVEQMHGHLPGERTAGPGRAWCGAERFAPPGDVVGGQAERRRRRWFSLRLGWRSSALILGRGCKKKRKEKKKERKKRNMCTNPSGFSTR